MMNLPKLLPLLFASSLLGACATTKPIEVTTTTIPVPIARPTQPRPVQLGTPKFYVVTEKNFDDFKKRFLEKNSTFVYYAISTSDFNVLLKNQNELLRYIKQQKAIIIYYEGVTDVGNPKSN